MCIAHQEDNKSLIEVRPVHLDAAEAIERVGDCIAGPTCSVGDTPGVLVEQIICRALDAVQSGMSATGLQEQFRLRQMFGAVLQYLYDMMSNAHGSASDREREREYPLNKCIISCSLQITESLYNSIRSACHDGGC